MQAMRMGFNLELAQLHGVHGWVSSLSREEARMCVNKNLPEAVMLSVC